MVMAPLAATGWTADMLRALPEDGKRYEVVRGELRVTPAPSRTHQEAVARLYARLDPYLRANRIGHATMAPVDVELAPDMFLQPDIIVEPLVDGRYARTWEQAGRLLLAVEVLSPGTARYDRGDKREIYQSENVPEYWIVDLDARLLERWRPGDERPEVLHVTLVWQPDVARPVGMPSGEDLTPLEIDLPAYFAEVLD